MRLFKDDSCPPHMKEIRISQEVYTKLACLCDARDYDGFSETIEELMKGQEVLL